VIMEMRGKVYRGIIGFPDHEVTAMDRFGGDGFGLDPYTIAQLFDHPREWAGKLNAGSRNWFGNIACMLFAGRKHQAGKE